jgi:methyl-accepting chemotaxis protein
MKSISLATRFAIASFVLLFVVLGGLAVLVSQKTMATLDERATNELAKQTELVIDMVATYDRSLRDAAERLGRSFASAFSGKFTVDPKSTVKVGDLDAPVMRDGATTLNLNFDAVDRFAASTVTGNATIFVRVGDDFYRVATSVKKEDGSRAVGTYLGKQSLAYPSMMKGETWVGKLRLFGKDFMTEYRPIKDDKGQVIGILYIGLDFTEGLKGLKDSIKRIKIGDTGYVFAFEGSGANQGLMHIHPVSEGKNSLKPAKPEERPSPILEHLVKNPSTVYRYMYSLKPEEVAEREKIIVAREFKGWGWIVGAGTWTDEFSKEAIALRNYLLAGMAAAGLLLAGLLYFGLRRMVGRPIAQAVRIADGIARGDLSQEIESKAKDETGQLIASLKAMNQSLRDVVGKVRTASDSIGTASNEIASGNQDLSSRTEEQASSLEETASSMEQLTATVKQNADNAKQANQLAASASDVAAKGGQVVSQVVDTMGSINDASKKIADIISVIDGIAFQTNILALNAAVEAARAGEQGKGFAVVASEVRSLAQKSAGAAKEIKGLIEDSVARVGAGSRLVEQAGQTMEEIVTSVKRVTDIMAEISAASAEQSSGIEQVNTAITQMDQTTQQNAALVEQAAAAAESMKTQAGELISTVGVFTLGGEKLIAKSASNETPAALRQAA